MLEVGRFECAGRRGSFGKAKYTLNEGNSPNYIKQNHKARINRSLFL